MAELWNKFLELNYKKVVDFHCIETSSFEFEVTSLSSCTFQQVLL